MCKEKSGEKAGWSLFGIATALAAVKVGWILYSKRYIDHNAKLKIILDAEQKTYASETAGKINYFTNSKRKGTPILLVHGLHLYAGLHDMLPVFEAFRNAAPVYAIDLPGFGRSEKGDRPYRVSMYEAAILDFIKNEIGEACHVLCLGNASEYVAMAAAQDERWFRSITMINPTGFHMPGTSTLQGIDRMERMRDLLLSWLKVPLWSLPVYDLFASRARITSFYHKRFAYSSPAELIDLAYTSSHQPGAHFAPIVLMSGKLNVDNVRERFYEKLTVPVLAVYDNDPVTSFDMLPQLVNEHKNWRAFRSRNTKGMPHFEKPGVLFRELDLFWERSK